MLRTHTPSSGCTMTSCCSACMSRCSSACASSHLLRLLVSFFLAETDDAISDKRKRQKAIPTPHSMSRTRCQLERLRACRGWVGRAFGCKWNHGAWIADGPMELLNLTAACGAQLKH